MSLIVDIEKRLGSFFLKESFEVENETLALFGASGCGKSMTLKCIAGIETPDKGKIILNGRTLFDSEKKINLPPQKRNVGYLFQQYALFPNMTVEQNILCAIKTNDKDEKKKILDDILDSMQVADLRKKKPNQLSGGQQQRVALARIIVNEPEVLLLDEPFSALDTHLRFQMENYVRDIIKGFDKTVIMVSHDKDEVFRLADKIAVLDSGSIQALGTNEEIFSDPVTVRSAILTGYRNITDIEINEKCVILSNWNITLNDVDIDPAYTHAGIRMNSCQIAEGYKATVERILYNPDSVLLLCVPSGAIEGIWIETSNIPETINEGSQIEISFRVEDLVFLKDGSTNEEN